MKAIMKYRCHPSIIAIKEKCNSNFSFSFSQVERDEIMKEISRLISIKQHKAQKYPQNLLKKTQIFLEILFLKTTTIAFLPLFSLAI